MYVICLVISKHAWLCLRGLWLKVPPPSPPYLGRVGGFDGGLLCAAWRREPLDFR